METLKKDYKFTSLDRCDKCQARACVLVAGVVGELMFCSHHYNKIVDNAVGYDKIMRFMVSIFDDRKQLVS